MIEALHGNAGLPEDLLPLLHATGREYRAWHLWRWLEENPGAASFDGISASLNAAAGSRPRVLLGYSLGARLALHALTQQPDTWDAAILISAHPGLTDEKERAARLVQDQSWAARFLHEPWSDVIAAWNAQPVLAGEPVSQDHQQQLETSRREVAIGFDAWSLARQPDLRPLLPAVPCPVLWITGEKDMKFTALGEECCALLPCARHFICPDAGHRAHHAGSAFPVLEAFLSAIESRL